MFSRKRKLIDYEPGELSFPRLLQLQGALLAKLILVNDEIVRRDKDVLNVTAELPNMQRARETFAATVARLTEMNIALRAEFDRRQGTISH